MRTERFTPFHGRRLRMTKVDACGRPVYGAASQVVSKGFVKIEMQREEEAGTEILQRNAAGELMVSEKGEDQLKWLTVSIDFLQVDPDIAVMMNPTYRLLRDYAGNVVGLAESHSQDLTQGVGLEAWADVSGANLCATPGAKQSFVYFLLPWIVGGKINNLTIENGALNFNLSGRTHKNSLWGKGPYSVMLNGPIGAPVPGPLLEDVGPEEPRRLLLTTIAPPDDAAGAQPLSNPAGPILTVTKDATDATGKTAKAARGAETGTFKVNWGDGSAEATLAVGPATVTHPYAADGTYNVSCYDTADPNKVTVATITIPLA